MRMKSLELVLDTRSSTASDELVLKPSAMTSRLVSRLSSSLNLTLMIPPRLPNLYAMLSATSSVLASSIIQLITSKLDNNKCAFKSNAGSPAIMRAFGYAWSLPVTWQRWSSHHSIRHNGKSHHTRKANGFIFYRNGVTVDRSWHCGNINFQPLWLLWPWPWPYDRHIWT